MDERTRKLMFSHESHEWYTPLHIFKELDDEFDFVCDVASDPTNRLNCPIFYTAEDDGLSQDWPTGNIFCNPPYGRTGKAHLFVKKCAEHAAKRKGSAVLLIPARTDTDWYNRYVWDHNHERPGVEIRPVKGRIKFIPGPTNPKKRDPAAFASLVIIFHPSLPQISTEKKKEEEELEQQQEAVTVRKKKKKVSLEHWL